PVLDAPGAAADRCDDSGGIAAIFGTGGHGHHEGAVTEPLIPARLGPQIDRHEHAKSPGGAAVLDVPAVQSHVQTSKQEVINSSPGRSVGAQSCGVRRIEDEMIKTVAGAVIAPCGNEVHCSAAGLTQL